MNNWFSFQQPANQTLSTLNSINNPPRLPTFPATPDNTIPNLYLPVVPLPKY
ncbi:hypothetical protein IQ231_22725 [Cuspidothrix issatschenkoi LEGE 03284]|uniref:hypothetical protein n=1 Tax=Cuspidothrix issatschenkoi TaxID=230752 RepID=UPI001882874A|nr:hypothetical protein [Cuspidothrix issatschenkoi]MBE9234379.1 hypothetical protein [Cuspidothrix issatschenkoi LEGE 03284]